MRSLIKILFSFSLLVLVVFLSLRIPNTQLTELRDRIVGIFIPPLCSQPIKYNIGTFDNEFKMSKEEFINMLYRAEYIWEKPSGLDLFTYAPEAYGDDVIIINLIYDYRQEATSKLGDLGVEVKDNKSSYDLLKIKFNNLTAQYELDKADFNTLMDSFNQRNIDYAESVSYWNKKNGAPKAEFALLERERIELEKQSRELKIFQTSINNMASDINALVVELNRLVGVLNLSVDKYNTVNTARGESFEEGVYYHDGYKAGIDIYEFSSKEKLIRVLAHEFGHALNLDHVNDKKAIMYYLNHDNSLTLSSTDLDELKLKCGK